MRADGSNDWPAQRVPSHGRCERRANQSVELHRTIMLCSLVCRGSSGPRSSSCCSEDGTCRLVAIVDLLLNHDCGLILHAIFRVAGNSHVYLVPRVCSAHWNASWSDSLDCLHGDGIGKSRFFALIGKVRTNSWLAEWTSCIQAFREQYTVLAHSVIVFKY